MLCANCFGAMLLSQHVHDAGPPGVCTLSHSVSWLVNWLPHNLICMHSPLGRMALSCSSIDRQLHSIVCFALFHNAVSDWIANNSLHASTWETTSVFCFIP